MDTIDSEFIQSNTLAFHSDTMGQKRLNFSLSIQLFQVLFKFSKCMIKRNIFWGTWAFIIIFYIFIRNTSINETQLKYSSKIFVPKPSSQRHRSFHLNYHLITNSTDLHLRNRAHITHYNMLTYLLIKWNFLQK